MTSLLIANRGEIAVRIIRAARDLGLSTVAIHSLDDADSMHVRLADTAVELPGSGPAAYLDGPAIIATGRRAGATLVHPGYGFLSESADFARACADAGFTFLGPSPDALLTAGSKTATRDLAIALGIPVPEATAVLTSSDAALELLSRYPEGIALKAVAGGGGRGIAIVTDAHDLPAALTRCRSEALHGFGDDRVFAERLIHGARHIEVQAIGAAGGVRTLGDRDCSLQRRRQKLIEIAPAPRLDESVREAIHDAAWRLLTAIDFTSLATVEFLVNGSEWVLLEVNPRIQVEHPVTEATTGVDLVACQIEIGLGSSLDELELPPARLDAAAGGYAVELRVAAETMDAEGTPQPAAGVVRHLGLPTGLGIRIDTWVRPGSRVSTRYDTLLAKVIVSGRDVATLKRRAQAALSEFECTGVATNAAFLMAVLSRATLGESTTRWVDDHLPELLDSASGEKLPPLDIRDDSRDRKEPWSSRYAQQAEPPVVLEPGEQVVVSPVTGTVVSLEETPGELGLIEAMKMHHAISSPPYDAARALVEVGDQVASGQAVFAIVPAEKEHLPQTNQTSTPHPGITEVLERHAKAIDDARPEAIAAVHARGRRTARENLGDLLLPGSFVEYGPLAIAAQTARREVSELIKNTSGDGIVGGIGHVKTPVGSRQAVVMSYDYMVMAGTQGARGHAKTDRLLQVAAAKRLPVILFAEGGGGRPGDTDIAPGSHLGVQTFAAFASLKGKVPIVTIVSGRCFAGNAALAGLGDLIIATEDANIGMGGPAMIAGGGLGEWSAEDIGPASQHARTGAIDLLVPDDAAAVQAAQSFLAYFGDRSDSFSEPDPTAAALAVPHDRLRAFSMRATIESVVDIGSFFEVREIAAPGAITALARVEGRAVAIIANNNQHLGGAIDVEAARSFVEHLTFAEAHGIPVVSFIDTPGFMVGPAAEEEPGVKVFGGLFAAGARLSVPVGVIIIRKSYGLGAMAMATGSLRESQFTVAWPSGELGAMGLEGAVRLGYAKELATASSSQDRDRRFSELLADLYEEGRALSAAMVFDIDDVIDPGDTRRWIATL
ncbi:acetyl-CoA carboxylase family protein [Leucobacter aridicollis]|uniref:acetyl-CoA carboxylase family protein n=1 Tax=Leucobacter aridicollis TaxID=283878 RepID=UPI0021048BF1|nr:carboxyl transferase domain-containing protein [Leucobacter aridicollis]UTX53205.1 carbamoyl-phosphate synthase large subunit [Leucobacter aridicollis]